MLFSHLQTVKAKESDLVYVVPIEQQIERGLEQFLERAFEEAEAANADALVLEINTLGGAVDAAINIGDLIERQQIPVIAYIKKEAISAGSFIALNADQIYMEPNSFIGAAAVRTITGSADVDPKISSFWASHMGKAAENRGRNPEIAVGMVDPNIEIAGLTKRGNLITLNANQALEHGYAEGIVKGQEELLSAIDKSNAQVVEVSLTFAERIARFVTSPVVMTLLIVLGLGGIITELLIPGFGVPGILGVSSIALYFFGHYVAGFAGIEDIIFFILGFVLMVVEIFVPGFGLFGASGVILLMLGVTLAAFNTKLGLMSLIIAIAINTVLILILTKYFGHKGVWNRFILREEQKKEGGYVSHRNDKALVGKRGVTYSKLRPSGTAIIDDKKYDVVSEGELIDANKEIVVVLIEGTRIVVKEVKK